MRVVIVNTHAPELVAAMTRICMRSMYVAEHMGYRHQIWLQAASVDIALHGTTRARRERVTAECSDSLSCACMARACDFLAGRWQAGAKTLLQEMFDGSLRRARSGECAG